MGDCVELEKYATKSIGEKCSFKAVNSRGEIIGVAMNGIVKKPVIFFQSYMISTLIINRIKIA